MNFLQDWLLYALPLALLPIIIHLINQNRHRTVKWAAMMFLLDAKKMTKGIARLRQILILSLRVLAVVGLILAAARPLTTGWLALTAGRQSDTVIVLLDRSSSMEQQNLETGISKRATALSKLADMLNKTAGNSRIVLIESANLESIEVAEPDQLLDLPSTYATDTSADIPSLLQAALDYIAADESGRTDIWLASDLRQSDWKPADGRWDSLRAAFNDANGVSFFLLNYPELANDNLAVTVNNLVRRRSPEGFELVMDLMINKPAGDSSEAQTVPVETTINGTRTVQEMEIQGGDLVIQGHTVKLGKSEPTGWGRIDLPADSNLRDNTCFFVFDEAPVLKTIILSDDTQTAAAIRAAAVAGVDSSRKYAAEILPTSRQAEIPWKETALLFWQDDLPEPESPLAQLLTQFVSEGKSLVLLPPADGFSMAGESSQFLGFKWRNDSESHAEGDFKVNWWRTDSGLLKNTQNGNPLPLGTAQIFRVHDFDNEGEIESYLKIEDGRSVIAKHINPLAGNLYIWATLPRSSHSSLGSDGVAFFVMIHRALQQGGNYLSKAQQRSAGSLTTNDSKAWSRVAQRDIDSDQFAANLVGGAFEKQGRWLALNRPDTEDDLRMVSEDSLADLFAGLDYRVIKDSVNNRSSLAAEIWKVFLVIMALALVLEAVLCLPPREEPVAVQ